MDRWTRAPSPFFFMSHMSAYQNTSQIAPTSQNEGWLNRMKTPLQTTQVKQYELSTTMHKWVTILAILVGLSIACIEVATVVIKEWAISTPIINTRI
eukprot:m.430535 g.430535  ORF g.430535 m.430535 type:complete len:97 (+) comp17179_c0_seq1:90-380(+)